TASGAIGRRETGSEIDLVGREMNVFRDSARPDRVQSRSLRIDRDFIEARLIAGDGAEKELAVEAKPVTLEVGDAAEAEIDRIPVENAPNRRTPVYHAGMVSGLQDLEIVDHR